DALELRLAHPAAHRDTLARRLDQQPPCLALELPHVDKAAAVLGVDRVTRCIALRRGVQDDLCHLTAYLPVVIGAGREVGLVGARDTVESERVRQSADQ